MQPAQQGARDGGSPPRLGWTDPSPGVPREDDEGLELLGPGARPRWPIVYQRLGERVYRLCHRMTENEEDARDLAQETFARAMESEDQYDPERGSLESWIFTIAANLAKQAARRRAARQEEALADQGVVASGEGRLISRLLFEQALAILPEHERTVYLLHEVDGYDHAEIADMLGIAVGSSRSRASRARARMMAFLEDRL